MRYLIVQVDEVLNKKRKRNNGVILRDVSPYNALNSIREVVHEYFGDIGSAKFGALLKRKFPNV